MAIEKKNPYICVFILFLCCVLQLHGRPSILNPSITLLLSSKIQAPELVTLYAPDLIYMLAPDIQRF